MNLFANRYYNDSDSHEVSDNGESVYCDESDAVQDDFTKPKTYSRESG